MRILVLSLVAATGALPSPSTVGAQPSGTPRRDWPQQITLAILPYQVSPHIYDLWTPAADHLSGKLGVFVRVTRANVYEDYVREVLVQRPELAYFNSLQYMTAHRDGGYDSMEERATLLGGRLEVESEPGRGAVVRARLPLVGGSVS